MLSPDCLCTVYRGDIHHHPWPLAAVELDITQNTLASAYAFDLAGPPALAHYVDRLDVVGWTLQRV